MIAPHIATCITWSEHMESQPMTTKLDTGSADLKHLADRTPRAAQQQDLSPLAKIWFDGWRAAPLKTLPATVAADRTLESFRDRLAQQLGSVRTVGPVGAPLGFSFVKGEELYQFYVDGAARGTGMAA